MENQESESHGSEKSDTNDFEVKVLHPIVEAINKFLHSTRDIKEAGLSFIPASLDTYKKKYEKIKNDLNRGMELINSDNEQEKCHGQNLTLKTIKNIERLECSKIHKVLADSLFVNLFSAFDILTGELIEAFYLKKPELFDKLNEKSVEFSKILNAKSLEEVKYSVLYEEIENFRRDSYIAQFKKLETAYNIELRKFKRWSDFVECSQRRNLITHCGGLISEQYLKTCKEEGCNQATLSNLGDRVVLEPKYLFESCELLIEVGFKLGQTLWRKLFPDELEQADRHLQDTQYDALSISNWNRAKVFGEYGCKITKVSKDTWKRIFLINYAISLKFSGAEEKAVKILEETDWSSSLLDFQLALAVLSDQFIDAAALMRRIGAQGEMINENAYHIWPLFREFRTKEVFAKAYFDVYGYEFIEKLKDKAEIAKADALDNIEKSEHQVGQIFAMASSD